MLVWLAGVLAFVALGLAIYAEWTDDKIAEAVGFLAGVIVLMLFAWQIKSVLAKTNVADNSEGVEIAGWLLVGGCFVLLYLAIGLKSLLSP